MFEDIKIFLAYKTKKWLSVVYSIKADEPSIKTGKGLAEIGITINMQTGERVMLDDLFSLQDLEGWLVGHGFNEVYLYRGELVLMDALFVNEIPLPEIYEYLKVDPWYD